jgi:hypothetical protein
MNYYQFFPHDQVRNNWLMFTQQKSPPYVGLQTRFSRCVCPKCKKIDHDKAFAEGFDEPLKIRAKGDLFGTSEGFICFSDKAKQVIESFRFGGLTLKTIPNAGWWVVNVTCRVEADQGAYTVTKPSCDQCGRPKETIGLIRCLNQIKAPNQVGTFFSPTFDRGGSMNGGRDVFVTEDIVSQFKQQKLKGGMFARLLTPIEFAEIKAAGAEKNPLKWPKDSRVVL